MAQEWRGGSIIERMAAEASEATWQAVRAEGQRIAERVMQQRYAEDWYCPYCERNDCRGGCE